MTQEEKAKAYDEALEIARKINSGEGVAAPPDWTTCEVIFPQLKESEDEKIRKFILEVIKAYDGMSNSTKEKCISYLEKQKEQKPLEYLPKEKVYHIMHELGNLSLSDLIPIESEEYEKIDEITSDVRDLLNYPIEQKYAELNEEPKHTEVWVEGRTIFEQEGEPTERIKGNLEEIPSNVDLEKAAEELKPKCKYYSRYGCDISPMKECDLCEINPQPHWKEGFNAGAKWMAEQIKGGSK